jgi:hypothetical protein
VKVIDPVDLVGKNFFMESSFLEGVKNHNWQQYENKNIIIRGCSSVIIPTWAYMLITGKLAGIAHTIKFGNNHKNITVFRRSDREITIDRQEVSRPD